MFSVFLVNRSYGRYIPPNPNRVIPMPYRDSSWTERTAEQEYTPRGDNLDRLERHFPRQAFHRPHTSLGAAGHWVYMAGVMAPLVIGELIEDLGKRWRWARLASVGTALAYEALYTIREQKRRNEREAELADCRSRCRD